MTNRTRGWVTLNERAPLDAEEWKRTRTPSGSACPPPSAQQAVLGLPLHLGGKAGRSWVWSAQVSMATAAGRVTWRHSGNDGHS